MEISSRPVARSPLSVPRDRSTRRSRPTAKAGPSKPLQSNPAPFRHFRRWPPASCVQSISLIRLPRLHRDRSVPQRTVPRASGARYVRIRDDQCFSVHMNNIYVTTGLMAELFRSCLGKLEEHLRFVERGYNSGEYNVQHCWLGLPCQMRIFQARCFSSCDRAMRTSVIQNYMVPI